MSEFKCLINFRQLRTQMAGNLRHSFPPSPAPYAFLSPFPTKPQTAKMAKRECGKGGIPGVAVIALHFSSSTFHSFNFPGHLFFFFVCSRFSP